MSDTDEKMKQDSLEEDNQEKTFSIFDVNIEEDIKLLDMREYIQAN